MRRTAVRPAFTLFELLLVVIIVGVVASFAWPQVFGSSRRAELDESVRRVRAAVVMCRAQAMNETRSYRLLFREDGSIRLQQQLDPVYAPQAFVSVHDPWALTAVLLDHVWIESILPLPEGPPPLLVDDEVIEFAEFDEEQIPIEQYEGEFELVFSPDGTSRSLRWVLRHADGPGVQVTLDGRLGRVWSEPVESLPAEQVVRPEPLPADQLEEEREQEQSWRDQVAEVRG